MKSEYQRQGYFHLPALLGPAAIEELRQATALFDGQLNDYGVRDLMNKVPMVRALAETGALAAVAREILGERARPVRAVYFDKLPGHNWAVPWHQDTSIAVAARAEVAGFGPWSVKQGVPHVEPPAALLGAMVTLRLHLDDAQGENGPLRVIPATHTRGRIPAAELLALVERSEPVECRVKAGDLLLMCPLLLHASHKAKRPSHRRIIHIEYSAAELPPPLRWHEAAG